MSRMAALLSTPSGVASVGECTMFVRRRRNHIVCCAAATVERYSHVEIATVFCFDDCHMIGLLGSARMMVLSDL